MNGVINHVEKCIWGEKKGLDIKKKNLLGHTHHQRLDHCCWCYPVWLVGMGGWWSACTSMLLSMPGLQQNKSYMSLGE